MSARTVRPCPLIALLATVIALVSSATACGGGDTSDLPPPASPPPDSAGEQTPGLELSPAEQQAVDEARAKFDEFMNAYIEVSTADIPTPDTAEALFAQVDQHVGGGKLSQDLRTEIIGRWGNEQILHGALEWSFVDVIDVDLGREVDGENSPQVNLHYCIDATALLQVDAEAEESVGQPGGRHLWTVAAVWSSDWFGQGIEGWRLREREQLDQPC